MKNTKFNKFFSLFLVVLTLHLSVGCNYYMVASSKSGSENLSEVNSDKYVIVHFRTEASFHLANIEIDRDNNTISGYRKPISDLHLGHNNPMPKGNRFKFRHESPTNEIHIYVSSYNSGEDKNQISFDAEDISRIDVYDYQTGATVATYVFGTLGVIAAAAVIIGIIAILTKSSCPFIYVHDGNKFTFTGETFGGAISKDLERDDYMPLPNLASLNGKYQIKINNELKEIQYTDLAELFYVDHKPNTTIGTSQNGDLYELNKLQLPSKMLSEKGADLTHLVLKKDSINYMFLDEQEDNLDFSRVTLMFENNQQSNQGKLILTLKNTLWLDFATERFFAQFGSYYEKFRKSQKNTPTAEKIQWTKDQGMLLKVEIKTKDGWKEVEYINTIGPLAARTLVVPIKGIDDQEIEIRLTSGYHFWEIDYAAIDLSQPQKIDPQVIQIESAIDEKGIDVRSALMKAEGKYLVQPEVTNSAAINFSVPTLKEGFTRSIFLHTRGYYEYIRDYSGKPNTAELKKFKEPGSFTHFAKSLMNDYAGSK